MFTSEMSNEEVRKLLEVLNIVENISNVTVHDVNKAFRKLAKVTHPDKAGDGKTGDFQRLLNAYDKLKDYLKEKNCMNEKEIFESDYEERFFRENFERFNFPFQNKGSFTVGIEDNLADVWQEALENFSVYLKYLSMIGGLSVTGYGK